MRLSASPFLVMVLPGRYNLLELEVALYLLVVICVVLRGEQVAENAATPAIVLSNFSLRKQVP